MAATRAATIEVGHKCFGSQFYMRRVVCQDIWAADQAPTRDTPTAPLSRPPAFGKSCLSLIKWHYVQLGKSFEYAN